jgi:archaellum component FlaG (FlaF/FlaG flagellin family)
VGWIQISFQVSMRLCKSLAFPWGEKKNKKILVEASLKQTSLYVKLFTYHNSIIHHQLSHHLHQNFPVLSPPTTINSIADQVEQGSITESEIVLKVIKTVKQALTMWYQEITKFLDGMNSDAKWKTLDNMSMAIPIWSLDERCLK